MSTNASRDLAILIFIKVLNRLFSFLDLRSFFRRMAMSKSFKLSFKLSKFTTERPRSIG